MWRISLLSLSACCNRPSICAAAAGSQFWATLQANCAMNTLHIQAGRWAVTDWGSRGHLEGVGCLADAAGLSNSTVLIGLSECHLQQRTHRLLQVGPRPGVESLWVCDIDLWLCDTLTFRSLENTHFLNSSQHTAFDAMTDGNATAAGRRPARLVSFSASQSDETARRWDHPELWCSLESAVAPEHPAFCMNFRSLPTRMASHAGAAAPPLQEENLLSSALQRLASSIPVCSIPYWSVGLPSRTAVLACAACASCLRFA